MINLLSFIEKISIKKEYLLRVLSVSLVMFSLVLCIAIASFSPVYFSIAGRYREITAESQSTTALNEKSKTDEMKALVKNTNAKVNALLKTKPSASVQGLFEEVLAARTHDVYVSGLTYESILSKSDMPTKMPAQTARITLSGKSDTRQALLTFADALRQKKFFIYVDLPISYLISDTNVDYVIKIYVDPSAYAAQKS